MTKKCTHEKHQGKGSHEKPLLMAIEIVDLPIKHGDLPEGKRNNNG